MESLVSIVITNYNGLKHLKECFNSLYNLNYQNFEIIFVDNNSQDKSVEFIKFNYPKVKIIQNDEDYGFSGANNIGALKAKGKYIVLLNIDTIVNENWIIELVKIAESSKDVGIVASKQFFYYNRDLMFYAGGRCDKYGKSAHIGENKKDNKYLNKNRKTFYACGAGMLIKRALYERIGLFDPLYYAYSEDFDLSWRAWLSGYKVIYSPKSFLYHKIGQILGSISPFKQFLAERNKLRTLLKNYELKTLIKILPIYIGKRIGMILLLMSRFDTKAIIFIYIYIKALFWNIFHFRSLITDRKFIQNLRNKDDKFIMNLMNYTTSLDTFIKKSLIF